MTSKRGYIASLGITPMPEIKPRVHRSPKNPCPYRGTECRLKACKAVCELDQIREVQ